MSRVLRPALLLAAKDLRLEMRTRDVLTSVGLFALLVLVVASFAFPTFGEGKNAVAAGVLWMAFMFAGLLGMGRSFAIEKEDACIDGLLVSPVPREAIFLGKLIAIFAFTATTEAFILPIFIVLLQLQPGHGLPLLVLATFLGTLGIATVGTLFAGIAVNTRTREAILPLLVIPISIPVMIAAVKSSETALGGSWIGTAGPWLLLLGVFDVLFLLVGVATFPYVMEG